MYVRVEYKEQQSKVSFKIWHSILINYDEQEKKVQHFKVEYHF